MTFRSIVLSYLGIALVGVGFRFSLMATPKANAMNIYNDHLPIIGIDSGVDFNFTYKS
ncbi:MULTISPECIES: hypothetical protein [unclassified Prochlorococcus]|uniref:hypothetical protein n=1 Tax=unclassified Prochlorococcus TaxID=2627481 RepID=UPI00053370E2|nr:MULTISPECIES: hypothetical protein [unclassified Prochlorococcus]KGG14970.1 hypothetical protein EV06_1483 [Prochlorococcus sp. MIT 0602]KGG17194.1 hypothetical protein EV07_0629 [Prochlorococcus sp. MIT 0603]